MAVNSNTAPLSMREDLEGAVARAWQRLGEPGTWWSGEERVAIAAETRNALSCAYCRECKAAVSPYGIKGDHSTATDLPAVAVDVIHRLVNDQGRLTSSWFNQKLDDGLAEGQYVEIVALAAQVVGVDTLLRGLGLALLELPEAVAGEPTRILPEKTSRRVAWVQTIHPKDATGEIAEAWWPDGEQRYVPHVMQALSLAPREAIAFMKLVKPMYLGERPVEDAAYSPLAISRPQMELLAARTSALNECYY